MKMNSFVKWEVTFWWRRMLQICKIDRLFIYIMYFCDILAEFHPTKRIIFAGF